MAGNYRYLDFEDRKKIEAWHAAGIARLKSPRDLACIPRRSTTNCNEASGKTLKPLQTRRGLVFIESRYLSPVSDVLDVLELYERVTPFGAPYIVAKAGFLLQAVIMPCDVISAQFVQRLQELTRQCAVSLDLREQERERQAAAESAGQFKVDPETGAIIEPESEAGDDD